MTPTTDSSRVSSTGAVVVAANDEAQTENVQSRLDSLLERAKMRQQQRSFGM